MFYFLIYYLNSRDIKGMRGDGSNGKETSKGTKEKQGAKNQLWRKCGGGGGISERESTWEVITKSETFFRSETEQEVGQR